MTRMCLSVLILAVALADGLDESACARDASGSSAQALACPEDSDTVSFLQSFLQKHENRESRQEQKQSRANASAAVVQGLAIAVNASSGIAGGVAVVQGHAVNASIKHPDSDTMAPLSSSDPLAQPQQMPIQAAQPVVSNVLVGPFQDPRLAPKSNAMSVAAQPQAAYPNFNQGAFIDLSAALKQNWEASLLQEAQAEEMASGNMEGYGDGSPTDGILVQNQNYEVTSANRYPAIFHGLQELLNDRPGGAAKLLSFGCSDGSEVRTLRTYFPGSTIHGVDVDANLIANNSARNTDPFVKYYSATTNLQKESYDAVIALSVLCRQKSTIDHLPFGRFIESLELIDSLVRPGGFVVLYNTDFPFSQYPYAYRYQNMASGCQAPNDAKMVQLLSGKATIVSADQRPPDGYTPAQAAGQGQLTGVCSSVGKYCLESGWRWKWSYDGQLIQPHGNAFFTFGCMHAGTFFKKLMAIPAKDENREAEIIDEAGEDPEPDAQSLMNGLWPFIPNANGQMPLPPEMYGIPIGAQPPPQAAVQPQVPMQPQAVRQAMGLPPGFPPQAQMPGYPPMQPGAPQNSMQLSLLGQNMMLDDDESQQGQTAMFNGDDDFEMMMQPSQNFNAQPVQARPPFNNYAGRGIGIADTV